MSNPLSKKNKAWSARFSEPVSEIVQKYTASVEFDKKLAIYDIEASQAHAEMLQHKKIISSGDFKKIRIGLNKIKKEIKKGDFKWSIALEDVHLNIENRLTQLIGDAGKKLHTARSRNDQIATDLRLYLRDQIDEIRLKLAILRMELVKKAELHCDVIMPGFTHLQVAQPINFGHHLLAYEAMFARDDERLVDARKRVNIMPLGSAALAGTSFPIDRIRVAKNLKFDLLCENSMDAVSDRDFVIEVTSTLALTMIHFSRISEEIVLWMSSNFNFITISDKFCTGSSIMPQKKNPDVPELARGKTGRVIGSLMTLLTLMKSQPLAYNKDNQEDKEPLFDAVETVSNTTKIFIELIANIKPNPQEMKVSASRGYSTATDLADYLVKKNIPFREAHEIVSKIVSFAIENNLSLNDIPLLTMQKLCPLVDKKVFKFLNLKGSTDSRKHIGGTSSKQVLQQAKKLNLKISKTIMEIEKIKNPE